MSIFKSLSMKGRLETIRIDELFGSVVTRLFVKSFEFGCLVVLAGAGGASLGLSDQELTKRKGRELRPFLKQKPFCGIRQLFGADGSSCHFD